MFGLFNNGLNLGQLNLSQLGNGVDGGGGGGVQNILGKVQGTINGLPDYNHIINSLGYGRNAFAQPGGMFNGTPMGGGGNDQGYRTAAVPQAGGQFYKGQNPLNGPNNLFYTNGG
jgi:hypothetical protein